MFSKKTTSLALYSFLAIVGCWASVSSAQSPTPPSDADVQWTLLSREVSIAPQFPQGGTLSADSSALLKKAVAQQLIDRSNQAKDFYSKYPSHPKAKEAKKIEAVSAVRAAQAGAVEEEPRAFRLGMAFRNDSTNDEKDRFQVALTMVEASTRQSTLATAADILADYEKKADAMVLEFPKNGDAYSMYIGVMRWSAPEKAKAVAQKILLAPAPADVKDQAQAFLDRFNMVGNTLPLEFTSVDGKSFNLPDQRGKIVVAYVWTAQSPYAKDLFQAVSNAVLSVEAIIVGINIDQDVSTAAAVVKSGNAPGLQYSDKRGLKSPVAAQLKVFDVPLCYVIAKDGRLVGYGSSEELPGLIMAAGK